MKFLSLLLLPALGLLSLAAPAPTAPDVPQPVRRALEQVQPEAIRAHIAYLADDRLLGRKPGTPGYQLAVDYVVAQLKERGVAPAGENGGFTQLVRLRRATVQAGAAVIYQPPTGRAGLPLDAVGLYPHPEQPAAQLPAAGLVFAGYGITAPQQNYDDYQGLDARGKVVVVLRGAPRTFPSTVAAASQDQTLLVRTAAAHGAVGVLFATLRPASTGAPRPLSTTSVLGADGRVAAARGFVSGPGGVALTGTLSAAGLQALLRNAATDTAQVMARLRQGTPAPVALPGTLDARWQSVYQDFDSYNVVGKITGSDARAARRVRGAFGPPRPPRRGRTRARRLHLQRGPRQRLGRGHGARNCRHLFAPEAEASPQHPVRAANRRGAGPAGLGLLRGPAHRARYPAWWPT